MTHDAQCEWQYSHQFCGCTERALAQAQSRVTQLEAVVNTRDLAIKRWCDELAQAQEHNREQEEAFEVWSSFVCKHGPQGTHPRLADLARCLLETAQGEIAALKEALRIETEDADSLEEEIERLKAEKYTAWRFGTPFDPTGVKTGTEINSLRDEVERLKADLDAYYAENRALKDEAEDDSAAREAYIRDHLRQKAEVERLTAAIKDAPDMTCESPEARAWREKYGLTKPGGQP